MRFQRRGYRHRLNAVPDRAEAYDQDIGLGRELSQVRLLESQKRIFSFSTSKYHDALTGQVIRIEQQIHRFDSAIVDIRPTLFDGPSCIAFRLGECRFDQCIDDRKAFDQLAHGKCFAGNVSEDVQKLGVIALFNFGSEQRRGRFLG